MKLSDFDFEFPQELIASRTAGKGKTRILHVDKSSPDKLQIYPAVQICDLIQPGDCVVVNNTKVIPARLFGHKTSGGKVEILLVRARPDIHDPSGEYWEAWVKPGKAFQVGKTLQFTDIWAEVAEILPDGSRLLYFQCRPERFQKLLEESGKVPLPPYIRREADDSDKEAYQTIFAKKSGAVAAPTASLHFSNSMQNQLLDKGVSIAEVTLHVGPGTFQNVQSEDITEHRMHSEQYELDETNAAIINQCRDRGGRIISVGTTCTRVLETLGDANGKIQASSGNTDIFIYPGYQWKVVNGLLTNFHWPKSTLVMLVASFLGREETLNAYKFAVEQQMKLFSYGDGMLIL
jgi:S-adenosylmethionine:tRNA ribosyltransferase-isomerase